MQSMKGFKIQYTDIIGSISESTRKYKERLNIEYNFQLNLQTWISKHLLGMSYCLKIFCKGVFV